MSKSIYEWVVIYEDNSLVTYEARTLDDLFFNLEDSSSIVYVIRKGLA